MPAYERGGRGGGNSGNSGSGHNTGGGVGGGGGGMGYSNRMTFDGKSLRKAIQRRTVDYNSSIALGTELRPTLRDHRDLPILRPNPNFIVNLLPTSFHLNNPVDACTTKFVHTSTNKIRCPVNVVKWTPEGRRLITGSTSGEFTLWNGLTFNFETILQAHDTAVRAMEWTHNDNWMVTADHSGVIKYWQSNMNNLKVFQGHKEAIRDIAFSPTDVKFATCSDDGTIKIWNFNEGIEERILTGHGWDVKCVDWHPSKALLASGSKDNLVKLWDPKSGRNLTTLHGHKATVSGIEWNKNGNWLATVARDQMMKVYDIRMMKELQTFRSGKEELSSLAWHPIHERLLATGGSEGSLTYWLIGNDQAVANIDGAHEQNIWSLDWHPVGHIIASGSNDHSTKFWTRERPGDASDKTEEKADGLTIGDHWEEDSHVPGLSMLNHNKNNQGSPMRKDNFAPPGLGISQDRNGPLPGFGMTKPRNGPTSERGPPSTSGHDYPFRPSGPPGQMGGHGGPPFHPQHRPPNNMPPGIRSPSGPGQPPFPPSSRQNFTGDSGFPSRPPASGSMNGPRGHFDGTRPPSGHRSGFDSRPLPPPPGPRGGFNDSGPPRGYNENNNSRYNSGPSDNGPPQDPRLTRHPAGPQHHGYSEQTAPPYGKRRFNESASPPPPPPQAGNAPRGFDPRVRGSPSNENNRMPRFQNGRGRGGPYDRPPQRGGSRGGFRPQRY